MIKSKKDKVIKEDWFTCGFCGRKVKDKEGDYVLFDKNTSVMICKIHKVIKSKQ